MSVHATPLVRNLAAVNKIDLATVPGTGVGGRITKHDVFAAAARRASANAPTNPAAPQPRVDQAKREIHNKITAGYAPWRPDLGGYPTGSAASDDRFEIVESGRAASVEEQMNGALFELTRGAAGERPSAKTWYIRDNNEPRFFENPDGTWGWEYSAVPAAQLPPPERPNPQKAAEEAHQAQQLEASLRRFI